MKKNIKFITVLILGIFFTCINTVKAETVIKDRRLITIDNKIVYKIYDNTETGEKDISDDIGKIILTIDGKEVIGYCVDLGMIIGTGTAEFQTIEDYYVNVLGETKGKQLAKKLIEYVQFGYGSEGRTTDKYYLATQQLIWQAISDTGFYATDFYVTQRGGSAKKLRVENFRWSNDGGTTTIDVSAEINAIQQSIADYYKTPSFCSSQNKLEIEVGETAEYTDNNNVLSKFEVSCDTGITCETTANKLHVTAVNEAGSNKINFLKKAPEGTDSYIYRRAGKQGVLTMSGRLEPVSCEFGIDSFKNEKTSDSQIVYILTIGLFCGVMAYIAYYTKKSLDELK